MVIGVEQLPARNLVAAVGHHLVDVHVALGTGARLPHHQGEVVVQLVGDHVVAGGADRLKFGVVQLAKAVVGHGGGLLQNAEGVDDLHRHLFGADLEVLVTPLGLGRPVAVRRDLHLTHAVALDAVFHCVISPYITPDKGRQFFRRPLASGWRRCCRRGCPCPPPGGRTPWPGGPRWPPACPARTKSRR